MWMFNSINGMSGVNDIYGLAYALWPAFYMTWLAIWWATGNNDVDQSVKDESQFDYKMSDLYIYCRKDIASFYKYYVYLACFAPIPAAAVMVSFF